MSSPRELLDLLGPLHAAMGKGQTPDSRATKTILLRIALVNAWPEIERCLWRLDSWTDGEQDADFYTAWAHAWDQSPHGAETAGLTVREAMDLAAVVWKAAHDRAGENTDV